MKLMELHQLTRNRLETLFTNYLQQATPAILLQEAMAYGVTNGGKRIRPLFVYAAGQAFGASLDDCDAAACAIEFIHAYSLIHDDLPAMDNADLRRGKPSCHKKYNEAIAILAGDALQTLAFDILATHQSASLHSEQRLAMIRALAKASGLQGMAGGQMLDMQGMDSIEKLTLMYQLKTGALLSASLELGALSANIRDPNTLLLIRAFAENLGLAFQIQDDLLDLQGEEITGKPRGLDTANNKLTFPGILGIKKTQEKIHELFSLAIQSIKPLGAPAEIFTEIAHYLMQRQA
jgi:farnesyl diphosphate synthase